MYVYIYKMKYKCIPMTKFVPVFLVGVFRGGDAFRGLVVPGELEREAVHAPLYICIYVNMYIYICIYMHMHI